MCVKPIFLPNGTSFACRKCWQCRENKINDWVGRCIAETKTSHSASAVTLTYGRDASGNVDHERAAVLTYSDVQKYLKRLRANGFPCRYFIVGEYGSLKGRSHWHALMFWLDKAPEHDLETRFDERHWTHGVSYFEKPNAASIRYVCKYIQKDIGAAERQGHLAMSKKPPLGAAYFRELAMRYVKNGLAPQRPFYSFRGVDDKHGNPVQFHMHGVTLDRFCQSYLDFWRDLKGGFHPQSDMIDDYLDRVAKVPALDVAPRGFKRGEEPWMRPPAGAIKFSNPHNSYYADQPDGTRLYWSFDLEGNRSWQSVIRGPDDPRPLRRPGDKAPQSYREAAQPSSRNRGPFPR